MPSTLKGRPIHHYKGHNEATLRAMGLDDGDIEEVQKRLKDNEYDLEVRHQQMAERLETQREEMGEFVSTTEAEYSREQRRALLERLMAEEEADKSNPDVAAGARPLERSLSEEEQKRFKELEEQRAEQRKEERKAQETRAKAEGREERVSGRPEVRREATGNRSRVPAPQQSPPQSPPPSQE